MVAASALLSTAFAPPQASDGAAAPGAGGNVDGFTSALASLMSLLGQPTPIQPATTPAAGSGDATTMSPAAGGPGGGNAMFSVPGFAGADAGQTAPMAAAAPGAATASAAPQALTALDTTILEALGDDAGLTPAELSALTTANPAIASPMPPAGATAGASPAASLSAATSATTSASASTSASATADSPLATLLSEIVALSAPAAGAATASAAAGSASLASAAGPDTPAPAPAAGSDAAIDPRLAPFLIKSPSAPTATAATDAAASSDAATPAQQAATAASNAAAANGQPGADAAQAAATAGDQPPAPVVADASTTAALTAPMLGQAQPGAVPTPATPGSAAKTIRAAAQNQAAATTMTAAKAEPATPAPAKLVGAALVNAADSLQTDAKAAAFADVDQAAVQPAATSNPAQPDATAGNAALAAATTAPTLAAATATPAAATLASAHGAEMTAQLAAQIANRGAASSSFDFSLDPQGLGRVDVSLKFDTQGQMSAVLSFDNSAAAAEAKSRAGDLQQALQQAGVDISQSGLSFTSGGGQGHGAASQGASQPAYASGPSRADAAADTPIVSTAARASSAGGLDITI